MPQLNFVPVKPTWSRMIHSSGVCASASTRCSLALTVRSNAMRPRLVPFEFDAVAPGGVAVHRGHEAEQAPFRAVAQQVAAHLDVVAGTDVLTLDAVVEDPALVGGLERPRDHGALVVLHLEIDDRVRRHE